MPSRQSSLWLIVLTTKTRTQRLFMRKTMGSLGKGKGMASVVTQ